MKNVRILPLVCLMSLSTSCTGGTTISDGRAELIKYLAKDVFDDKTTDSKYTAAQLDFDVSSYVRVNGTDIYYTRNSDGTYIIRDLGKNTVITSAALDMKGDDGPFVIRNDYFIYFEKAGTEGKNTGNILYCDNEVGTFGPIADGSLTSLTYSIEDINEYQYIRVENTDKKADIYIFRCKKTDAKIITDPKFEPVTLDDYKKAVANADNLTFMEGYRMGLNTDGYLSNDFIYDKNKNLIGAVPSIGYKESPNGLCGKTTMSMVFSETYTNSEDSRERYHTWAYVVDYTTGKITFHDNLPYYLLSDGQRITETKKFNGIKYEVATSSLVEYKEIDKDGFLGKTTYIGRTTDAVNIDRICVEDPIYKMQFYKLTSDTYLSIYFNNGNHGLYLFKGDKGTRLNHIAGFKEINKAEAVVMDTQNKWHLTKTSRLAKLTDTGHDFISAKTNGVRYYAEKLINQYTVTANGKGESYYVNVDNKELLDYGIVISGNQMITSDGKTFSFEDLYTAEVTQLEDEAVLVTALDKASSVKGSVLLTLKK